MRKRTLALAGILSVAQPAWGAVIAYDDFQSYTPGAQFESGAGVGLSGGTGWAAAWNASDTNRAHSLVATQPMSYSAGAVTVSDGGSTALRFKDVADNGLLGRTFDGISSGPVYVSFLYRTTNPLTDEDFIQMGLSDALGAEPKASVGTQNGSSTPSVFFARVPNGGTTNNSAVAFDPNTDFFVVAKFTKTTGSSGFNQVSLFVNPTTLTEPGAPTISGTSAANTGAATFSTFNIRTARIEVGDDYFIDRLVIADSYVDAIQAPEPGTLGLSAAAGLLALRRRRRA
ncbi:MAG: PEP-CTERM sorting domain-containing protein [Phycisphaerae bacterium]|nr:PEP-CTERM sorting domain-containing protein [Tepidisphaeraceae bacterium]